MEIARRDFALKLPMAVGVDSAVLVQVDPGNVTGKGLRSWEAVHGCLWAVLRKHGCRVQVEAGARTETVLRR